MGNANEDLVKKAYEAFGKGDMETLGSLMTADVVHDNPGDHQLAREYKGVDDVFGFYGQMMELTGGKFSVDLGSATAKGDDTVIGVHRVTGERNGKKLDVEETVTFTIKDGKITRLAGSFADQAAVNEFWG